MSKDNLAVGLNVNLLATVPGKNCMAVGNNATAWQGDNSVAFGDDVSASGGEVVVGKTLFGKEIPDDVKTLVQQNSQQVKWVVAIIANDARMNASDSPSCSSCCSKVVWRVPTHETPFGTMLETGLDGLTILMYRGQHGWKTLEAALAYARLSHQVYEKDLVGLLHDFSVREVCAVDLDCGKWRTLYASTDSEVSHP